MDGRTMAQGALKEGRTELVWSSGRDPVGPLMGHLMEGCHPLEDEVLLVLPDERSLSEVRRMVAGTGGWNTTWLFTPWALARDLYTRTGQKRPVLDSGSRFQVLKGVLAGMEDPSLTPFHDVRPGMVRHLSEQIKELILHGIGPERMEGLELSGKAKALGKAYRLYLERLRELDAVDEAEVPFLAAEAIRGRGLSSIWKAAGFCMVGKMEPAFEALLSAVVDICGTSIVVQHPCRGLPRFIERRGPFETISPAGQMDFTVPDRSSNKRSAVASERTVGMIVGNDRTDELRKVARRIKSVLLEGGAKPCGVGLVLPDERRKDPWTYAILDEYGVPYDQGIVCSVDQVPVVRSLLSLFRSAFDGLPRDAVLDALSVPPLGLLDGRGDRIASEDLERLTREAYIIGGGPDPVSSWLGPLKLFVLDEDRTERSVDLAGRVMSPLKRLIERVMERAKAVSTVEDHLEAILSVWYEIGLNEVIGDGRKVALNEDGPKGGLAEVPRKAVSKLMDALDAVRARSLLIELGPVGLKEVLELVGSELRNTLIETGAGTGGIKVLGPAEGAGTGYDHLFITGCVEGSLPPKEGPFSLLGEDQRRALSLPPLSVRREALEELCISLNSAKEPVISLYRTEGGSPVLPSPFIEGLRTEEVEDTPLPMSELEVMRRLSEIEDPGSVDPDPAGVGRFAELLDRDALSSRLSERLKETVPPAIRARARERMLAREGLAGTVQDPELLNHLSGRFGPEHVWSSSKLEAYRICPYSFLVRYVMDIEPLEEVEPGVTPEKMGTIFHAASDAFHRSWKGSEPGRILPTERERASALMTGVTDGVLSRHPYSGPFWDAIRQRLLGDGRRPGMVHSFIRSESDYTGPFAVSATELKFGPFLLEMPLERAAQGQERVARSGVPFLLRGSIDRCDLMEQNGRKAFFIWDYKTGASEVDRESLQVPLYLLAAKKLLTAQEASGGGYYYIRRPGDVLREPRLGREIWEAKVPTAEMLDGAIDATSSAMSCAFDAASDIISSVRNGSFPPKKDCRDRWCPYNGICRRGEP